MKLRRNSHWARLDTSYRELALRLKELIGSSVPRQALRKTYESHGLAWPNCPCHGEGLFWTPSKSSLTGGSFTCGHSQRERRLQQQDRFQQQCDEIEKLSPSLEYEDSYENYDKYVYSWER